MRFIFVLITALFFTGNSQAETITDKHNNRTFKIENIEGWKFLINVEILKSENWPVAKRIISNQLFGMKLFLKDEVIKDMQKVKIYVDIKQKGKSGAEYHPSKKWLVDNGFSPEKAKCIEISSIDQYLRYVKYQPWVMLHELIHSYHDQVLGFENKEIIECYKNALKAGKYGEVLHIKSKKVKHYSSTNHKEYFSEAAEAYFGTNDFYPFVRAELLEYDPDICKFLEKLAR